MATKYCEDCKFLVLSPHYENSTQKLQFAKCGARQVLVSRNPDYALLDDYASTSREFSHLCGQSGKWFQAKSAEDAASVSEAMPPFKRNLIKEFVDWFRTNWK